MHVGVYRVYNGKRKFSDEEIARKPVVIYTDVESLDEAEERFNQDERFKFPENWGWEFQDLEYDPLMKVLQTC